MAEENDYDVLRTELEMLKKKVEQLTTYIGILALLVIILVILTFLVNSSGLVYLALIAIIVIIIISGCGLVEKRGI